MDKAVRKTKKLIFYNKFYTYHEYSLLHKHKEEASGSLYKIN